MNIPKSVFRDPSPATPAPIIDVGEPNPETEQHSEYHRQRDVGRPAERED
jgi:hypothetical protein